MSSAVRVCQPPDERLQRFVCLLTRLVVSALLALILVGCQGAHPEPASVSSTVEPPWGTAPSADEATEATGPATPSSTPAEPNAAPAPPRAVLAAPAHPSSASAAPAAQNFSGQRARRDVDSLAGDIGPRVAGSPAQARAADHLAGQLEAAGLATERQPFTFSAYVDRGSSLEVLAPQQITPSAQTLTYSPGGEVEAELVYVDLARPGDFSPASVGGKVALAKRGEIRFSDKAANLASAGARAVVIFNNEAGSFAGTLATPGELPVIALSRESGEQLLSLTRRGATIVRLRVEADVQEQTGVNVIGTSSAGASTVVIGAHYDSVTASPGANDNASGTATMLELARVIAARQYPFTVRFVGFDAEEIGLIGSRHYVGQLDQTRARSILAMINLDMVGVGDRLSFGGDASLVASAIRQAESMGINAGQLGAGAGTGGSDHSSFQAVGVPALFVHRREDPRYHTADDSPEHVVSEHLVVAGEVVLAVLDDLAAQNR